MVRTKPGQKIHVDTLQTALSKLEQLETKPKSELNLRESIFFLKDKLNSALKKECNIRENECHLPLSSSRYYSPNNR